jgi:chorismate mutase
MSHSSRESDLAQLREMLLQLNSELFLTIADRRKLCVKIQEYKDVSGRYSHYDPEREREIFKLLEKELKSCSLRELLAFSLLMEDHAMAMAPGSYPAWSQRVHVSNPQNELLELINPLMLKMSRPDSFQKIVLSSEFQFLKDF